MSLRSLMPPLPPVTSFSFAAYRRRPTGNYSCSDEEGAGEAAFDLMQILFKASSPTHARADTGASHSDGAKHSDVANHSNVSNHRDDVGEFAACLPPPPDSRNFLADIRAYTGDYPRAIRLLTDVKRSRATAASTTAAAASAAASKHVSDEAGVAETVAGAVGDTLAVEEAVAESGDNWTRNR